MSIEIEVRPRVSLKIVDIATPCPMPWEQMTGDERVRFCGECRKNVYNISAMKQIEAEEFLGEHLGNVCIRLYRRADGTILTSDCPVGLRLVRRSIAATLTAIASLLSLLAALFVWRESSSNAQASAVPFPANIGAIED